MSESGSSRDDALPSEPGDALATVPAGSSKERLAGDLVKRAVDQALPDAPDELKRAAGQMIAPWAEKLTRALDDLIRIPGTKFGIGLDPIIGFFFPGAGDVVTGIGSVSLLFLALKHRIPTVVIGRMLMNIVIDSAVGVVPILGDVFDVFFRSNRRNLELIEQYKNDPKLQPSTADYVLVIGGILLAVAGAIIPMLLFWGLIGGGLLTCGGILSSTSE